MAAWRRGVLLYTNGSSCFDKKTPWRIVDTSHSRIVVRQHFFSRGGVQNPLEPLYTNTSRRFPPREPRAALLENILFYFSTPKISLMRGGVTKKLYKSTILVPRSAIRHFALNIPLTCHKDLLLGARG